MLSQVYSSAIFGVDAYLMEIEVNYRQSPRSETVTTLQADACYAFASRHYGRHAHPAGIATGRERVRR